MKPRDHCCCAIPVINVGIYTTLAEQFVLALLVAILALATPSLVGAAGAPSFGKVILAVICFAAAGVQVLGFLGVIKEKPVMFRRYTTLHILITLAAFSVALVWIIISATSHNSAKSDCLTNFFANTTTSSSSPTGDEGDILCNIFTWVDVGLMGGLWVILAIMQLYLYTVISSYGTGQRRDQDTYKSLYSTNGYESGIPLASRNDPWDARPSFDEEQRAPLASRHMRDDSEGSISTILGEKQQQEAQGYPPQRQGTIGSTYSNGGGFQQPGAAYTHEPQPTPTGYGGHYYQSSSGYEMQQPGQAQPHPAVDH